MNNSQIRLEMQERAKKYIPGKTQLLSKRPEMFAPGVWEAITAELKDKKFGI